MEKAIVLVILIASLLAISNAAIVYKRSYYLEPKGRVNLERLTDNVEQLNRDRLIRLSRHLVTISKSDFGILLLLNREFRRAILWLGISLLSLMLYVIFLQVRAYLSDRHVIVDSQ